MLVLMLLLVGCAALPPAGSPAAADESITPNQGAQKETDWLEVYDVVLSQYKDAINILNKDNNVALEVLGYHVNPCIVTSRSLDSHVYYALHDIDSNEVPELIVGVGNTSEMVQLGIFTYCNEAVVNVFQDVYKDVLLDSSDHVGHYFG